MEGRTEEDEKLISCQNPNSSNHQIIIRPSSPVPRPSPAPFHGMSDISPSPLPSLRNQILLPYIPTLPVPVPPTGKISPEKITFAASHPSLDPNSDSDPLAKEVATKEESHLGPMDIEEESHLTPMDIDEYPYTLAREEESVPMDIDKYTYTLPSEVQSTSVPGQMADPMEISEDRSCLLCASSEKNCLCDPNDGNHGEKNCLRDPKDGNHGEKNCLCDHKDGNHGGQRTP